MAGVEHRNANYATILPFIYSLIERECTNKLIIWFAMILLNIHINLCVFVSFKLSYRFAPLVCFVYLLWISAYNYTIPISSIYSIIDNSTIRWFPHSVCAFHTMKRHMQLLAVSNVSVFIFGMPFCLYHKNMDVLFVNFFGMIIFCDIIGLSSSLGHQYGMYLALCVEICINRDEK